MKLSDSPPINNTPSLRGRDSDRGNLVQKLDPVVKPRDDVRRIGVLLSNLGTPDAPTKKTVRQFLAEFLWDPYVVDKKPRWLWWLILHGIILWLRPKRVAKAYQTIWNRQAGSPLREISIAQCVALQSYFPENYRVMLGMRYGIPSIPDAMEKLKDCDEIVLLPMYPQYSISTTKSTIDSLTESLAGQNTLSLGPRLRGDKLRREFRQCKRLKFNGKLRIIASYHNLPGYIDALADSVKTFWKKHGKPDCLLLSFHGLPERYISQKNDPYYYQCLATASLLVKKLKLKQDQYRVTFQSRVGPEKWLGPYTDHVLRTLPKQGVKNVHVICPGFSADCLETLEEINMRGRALFLQHGGESFDYIPALNADVQLMKALSDRVLQ